MLRKPRHAGALTGLPSWCPIPVYFFDELSEILPSPHWRCLLTLWRLTLGWKKSGDYISLGGLGRRANVSRRIAAEALGWLRAADLVCIEKRRGTRGMNFVRIVTDYDPINVTSALRALVEQSKSKRASRESGKNRATQRTRTSAPNALGLEAIS
jgi:hypothetical protein